jgi:type I restriction enzyme R subunit
VVEEEVDDEGNVVDDAVVEEPEPVFDPGDGGGVFPEPEGIDPAARDPDGIDPDELDVEPRAKFYVDDVEVWVTAEATYHLDPVTQRLRLVEYRDFVTETVRSLFPDAGGLRSTWASRVGRLEVLDALHAHGIDAADLGERTGLPGADPLDVLVHLAWNQPLATRADRVRRVRAEHAAFFADHQPAAREVLSFLLEKYAEHGIGQLDDLGVLRVPPLSALGSPAEIAARFGTADALRAAVVRLSELLYAA